MKIKICGIKTLDNAQAAVEAGATHIGFVLFGKSPRNISPREAAAIANKIKDKVSTVIVTVNPSDELISETLQYFKPDYIQLHGVETLKRVKEIKNKFDIGVIKAIPVSVKKDVEQADKFKEVADYIMFDAKPLPGMESPGGNALAFEWNILHNLKVDYEWILSGGLTPENVKEAMNITYASFVDVSSGVEVQPGVKNNGLIESFVKNVLTR
jgi:phosphoribosylanthranilate isomerase